MTPKRLLPVRSRLCPADKSGKRHFAPVMLKRLAKLGIDKAEPEELTPEEVRVTVVQDGASTRARTRAWTGARGCRRQRAGAMRASV